MNDVLEFNKKEIKQVYNILKLFPKEQINKIPENVLEYIFYNKDDNYEFEINQNFEINSKTCLPGTIKLLEILFLEYIATEDEKKEILKIMDKNEKEYQNELSLKYNKDIFYKNREEINIVEPNNMPIVIKRENIFIKFLNIIKKVFGGK